MNKIKKQVTRKEFEDDETDICRICYEGDQEKYLIAPCNFQGTIAYI